MINAADEAQQFVIDSLSRGGAVPGATEPERFQCNYLLAGLIDSLGLIDLVMALEERFGIAFTSDEFEDPRFRIVGGLIEIVTGKVRHAANG